MRNCLMYSTHDDFQLTVCGSGSSGNLYVIQNQDSGLVIEAGVAITELQRAVGFNTRKIAGCIISHEHSDHARFIEKYMEYMKVYCSRGTMEGIKFRKMRRPIVLEPEKPCQIGIFKVTPFPVSHDANEPFGYLIEFAGRKVMFATDTYMIEYQFEGLTHLMIEANYDAPILKKNLDRGIINKSRMRAIKSHMSINTCIDTVMGFDLSKVMKIVLIHLSHDNADAKDFKRRMEAQTGIPTMIARKGLATDLNLGLYGE